MRRDEHEGSTTAPWGVIARTPHNEAVAATLQREVQIRVFERGMPVEVVGGLFRISQRLESCDTPERRGLVCFGESAGATDTLCVDPRSSEVVGGMTGADDMPVEVVNSSLEAFVETLRRFAGRFPFYDRRAGTEEIRAVADELEAIICMCDEAALAPGGFWWTVVDGARIGDWATEDVVGWEWARA